MHNIKLADDVKEKQFLHHINNGQDLVSVNAGADVTDLLVGSGNWADPGVTAMPSRSM